MRGNELQSQDQFIRGAVRLAGLSDRARKNEHLRYQDIGDHGPVY